MITDINILHLIKILNHKPIDFSSINDSALLQAAKLHRVSSLVYRALLTNAAAPTKLIAIFKIANQQNQITALKQFKHLSKLNQLLSLHNIPMLTLKGLLLSYKLYGDIGARASKDIDIFISSKNVFLVDRLMKQAGYQAIQQPKLSAKHEAMILSTYKDFAYRHPADNTLIEVHWQLFYPYMKFASFDEIWQSRKIINLSHGESFHTMAEEQEWLYLSLHGSNHCYMRIQWLCDVINYEKYYPGHDLKKLATSNKYHHKLSRYYGLTQYFISLAKQPQRIPEPRYQNFFHRNACLLMQSRHKLTHLPIIIRMHLFELQLSPGFIGKLKTLYYFARNKYMFKFIEFNIPPFLHLLSLPIYYFIFVPFCITSTLWTRFQSTCANLIKKVFTSQTPRLPMRKL